MRTLSPTLISAQQAASIDALVKIELTHGVSSYTFTRDRILDVERTEDGNLQSMNIIFNNSDGLLTNLDLKGYKAVLSIGAITGSGEEYSPYAPLWVIAQQFDSSQGHLICTLSLIGICNLLAEDKASSSYIPDENDTRTVKDLINAILGATLPCFSHCQAYTVDWDSEDSLIDSYQPKDSFRIYVGNNRLAAINRLLSYTRCVMRAEADGHIHIFVPTTSGTNYDYQYSLETGHTLFAKALRNRLVIPNYVQVQSEPDDDPQYSGYAQDAESYALMPKREFYQMHLESNEQATAIAEAILSKAQMWCEAGSAQVPINVGAEVFDYVKVTDERENDFRVGNIGKLTFKYTAGKNWRMTFTFGNWMSVRSVYQKLGVTADEVENSFSRLMVKNLYAENIMAENCDFVWLDPDNTIDLSKIGDNLDHLPDGEIYARVKSMHLDAGQIKLDEHVLYSPGYNPTDKFDLNNNDLDDIPEGVTYRRVKSAALTADGLVLMDQVVAGTYGKVLSTDISAGHITLSSTIQDSGHRTVSDTEKSSWNSRNKTFVQTSAPTAQAVGDLWFDSDDDYKVYRWNGSQWESVRDGEITQLRTDIDAGRITLSEYTVLNGAWRPKSGVKISATDGIVLFGSDTAFRTRATENGADQCYMGSDGAIYAGGGNIKLDSNGLTINGQYLIFKSGSTSYGWMWASSSANKLYLDTNNHIFQLSTGGSQRIEVNASMIVPVGTCDLGGGTPFNYIIGQYLEGQYATTVPYFSNAATIPGCLAWDNGTLSCYAVGLWKHVYWDY